MIAHLQGIVIESAPLRVLIDVHGVGYEVHIPLLTAEKIPPIGATVKLLTHLVVREDAQLLYGFHAMEDKQAFVALTEKVSGIGPKTALSILSRFSAQALRSAIVTGDIASLTQCPGIGKKTAERLILELKDVFGIPQSSSSLSFFASPSSTHQPTPRDDAIAALITLGFKLPEAVKKVESALKTEGTQANAEVLIRTALNNN